MANSVRQLLERGWAQITLAFLIGLALTYTPTEGWLEPLHHIGIGLLVAAVVTAFWHMREFAEYFERFAETVLVRDTYMSKLSVQALSRLRTKAARTILESCVDNPAYERAHLEDWLDDLLYENLLPGSKPLAGIYREGMDENIALEFPLMRDVLKDVNAGMLNVPSSELDRPVLKVTSVTRYTVVSPKLTDTGYQKLDVPYSGKTSDMPRYFPLDKRIAVYVGAEASTAKEIFFEFSDDPMGGVRFKPKTAIALPFTNGKCPVWMKTIEYRLPQNEAHILNMMGMLTRGMTLTVFQSGGPKLVFDGGIIATGDTAEPQHNANSISLKHDHWLFENHGYYVWWWERV